MKKIILFALAIALVSCKKEDKKPVNPERQVVITMSGKGLFWYEGNLGYGNPGHTGLPLERTVITDGVPGGHHVSILVEADNKNDTMYVVMEIKGDGIYKVSGKGKQHLFYQN